MKTDTEKYLNRPIGENEDELLDEIWNSLRAKECGEHILDRNYQDVKSRIRRGLCVRVRVAGVRSH